MEPRITVRRVRTTDLAAYRALRLRALALAPGAFGSTLDVESRYEEARWADRVERGAASLTEATWVAERSDGSLGGMVVGVLTGEHVAEVFGMWVDPEIRGRGIGSELLDTMLGWAERAGPSVEVRLWVAATQGEAVGLYRSRGFAPTGAVAPLGHTPGDVLHEMVRRPSEQIAPPPSTDPSRTADRS